MPKKTYAEAKKADKNLDSYIAQRKKLKKGSPEYNAIQNKINAAYGVEKRHPAEPAAPKVERSYSPTYAKAELRHEIQKAKDKKAGIKRADGSDKGESVIVKDRKGVKEAKEQHEAQKPPKSIKAIRKDYRAEEKSLRKGRRRGDEDDSLYDTGDRKSKKGRKDRMKEEVKQVREEKRKAKEKTKKLQKKYKDITS